MYFNCFFCFFTDIPIGIKSSAIRIKACVITSGIKKHKSIIKKKWYHDKIVLLANPQLNNAEVLISKALIDSSIIHHYFFLIHNVWKDYGNMKKETKKIKT